jgi:hypothetical protein
MSTCQPLLDGVPERIAWHASQSGDEADTNTATTRAPDWISSSLTDLRGFDSGFEIFRGLSG